MKEGKIIKNRPRIMQTGAESAEATDIAAPVD